MKELFGQIQAMAKELADIAAATDDVQKVAVEDTGWQSITVAGKVVGRYRISGIEITITPKPARRQRKSMKTTEGN